MSDFVSLFLFIYWYLSTCVSLSSTAAPVRPILFILRKNLIFQSGQVVFYIFDQTLGIIANEEYMDYGNFDVLVCASCLLHFHQKTSFFFIWYFSLGRLIIAIFHQILGVMEDVNIVYGTHNISVWAGCLLHFPWNTGNYGSE